MRYLGVEQELFCSRAAARLSSCLPSSRTLHAACGGALHASLTFAARADLGEHKSGWWDSRIDRATGRLAGSPPDEVGHQGRAVVRYHVDGVQQLACGADEAEPGQLAGGTRVFIEGPQKRVAAQGTHHVRPQRDAQRHIAEWRDGGSDLGVVSRGRHGPPIERPGASQPEFMLPLVEARMQADHAWPHYTFRAANPDRGRQPNCRRHSVKRPAAISSQQLVRNFMRGTHR